MFQSLLDRFAKRHPIELKAMAFGVEPSRRSYFLRLARYRALAESVVEEAEDKKTQNSKKLRLLDVGVGKGRTARYLEHEPAFDSIEFFGVDLSRIRLNSIYGRNRWKLAQVNLTKGLPFDAGSFDVVICEQVLEHLPDPYPSICELARVLKPSGLLILGVPVFPIGVSHIRQFGVLLLEKIFQMRREHLQSFNNGSIKKLVHSTKMLSISESRGFRVVVGGCLAPLEDQYWWYKFNRWLGSKVPGICIEVQILARRNNNGVPITNNNYQ